MFIPLILQKREKERKERRQHGGIIIHASRTRFDLLDLVLLIDGIGGKTLGRTFYEHASGHLMRDAIYVERVCAIGEVIRIDGE